MASTGGYRDWLGILEDYQDHGQGDDLTFWATPDLVESFVNIKVRDVRHPSTAAQHAHLGRVVFELRRRGVLS